MFTSGYLKYMFVEKLTIAFECLHSHSFSERAANNQYSDKIYLAAATEFECAGCKSCWTNKNHVVGHKIENTQVYFCLNCEDWIKQKDKVLLFGWSLFDCNGDLRHDV